MVTNWVIVVADHRRLRALFYSIAVFIVSTWYLDDLHLGPLLFEGSKDGLKSLFFTDNEHFQLR